MQNTAPPRRRRHVGTWIVVIVAFAELAALGLFVTLKDRFPSCKAEISQRFHGLLPGGGPSMEEGGNVAPRPAPPAAPPKAAASTPTVPDSASAGGNITVSGDTSQVPDPNCVGKTAAGLLSESTPSAQPSCAPMSPPPELKKAEQQLSNGSIEGQTSPPATSASP